MSLCFTAKVNGDQETNRISERIRERGQRQEDRYLIANKTL
jgi:hypothetical protein